MVSRRHVVAGLAAAPFAIGGRGVQALSIGPLVINGAGVLPDADEKAGYRLSHRDAADIRAAQWSALTHTVSPSGNAVDGYARTLDGLARTQAIVAANPKLLAPVRSAADVRAAHGAGRLGIICAVQDSSSIGPALDRLELLQTNGLRVVQLTYNKRNLAGDGALETHDGGVSDLGRQTIAAIERARLVLDLSHAGALTGREAIAIATRPMLISHTGARAVFDHPRNIDDGTLRACADKGGVVGVYFIGFLARGGHPGKADLIAHLDHLLAVCGEDHISIGTDTAIAGVEVTDAFRAENRRVFEQRRAAGLAAPGEGPDVFNFTEGYNAPDRLHRLADDLAAHGWRPRTIEKLLGANYLRVCAEIWGG